MVTDSYPIVTRSPLYPAPICDLGSLCLLLVFLRAMMSEGFLPPETWDPHTIVLLQGGGRWRSPWRLGMKMNGNGRENPATISVSIFYYGKRERERNSWVREQKRDITVTETDGNRKIYRNALVFNHHSFCMNITLDTPLHKLFFKNMINISCFLRLNREIYVLMLRNIY